MILHQSTMKELAPLLAAALVLCVAAACADRRRQLFWGRSLGVKLLPLFVVLGMARGFGEEHIVLAEQKAALEKEESTYGTGELCGITEKESWTVLLLKNVQTEEGKLRFLQVYTERAEYRIGDVVRVWGEFTQFQPASNPGEFDYAAYYRGQKLIWRVFALAVHKIENGEQMEPKFSGSIAGVPGKAVGQMQEWGAWTNLRRISYVLPNGILRFRMWAVARLKLLAGEEDGSIFAAMLLGDKTGMPEEIRELYQKNGIAHLLAVSGLHLSLVSMAAYGLLRKAGAGYGRAAVAGGLVLMVYSILTGASPSVLRALIMTLCGFLAAYLGRTYDLLSAMGLSALILLWYSPYLVDQAGVQLSFAAIGGIGLEKELEAWSVTGTEQKDASEKPLFLGADGESAHAWEQPLRLTLCMQLVSLPVVLWHFFSYPLYGIFLNLLVVPLTGIIVGSGAASLLVSLFMIRAGTFLAGGGRAVLAWYELCCRWFMRLPGSSLLCGRPELWQIVVYYMALGVLFYVLFKKYSNERTPAFKISRILYREREMILACFLLASLFFLRPPAVHGLEVTILDTGQGDGICIRTKDRVILVDGGSTDQKELGKYRLEPFFQSRGIRQIDLAIITHGDWDHISGLSWLMEQAAQKAEMASGMVAVRTLAMPEAGKGEEVYERLEQLCEKQGGQTVWIARGDEVSWNAGDSTAGSLGVQSIWKRLGRQAGRNGKNLLHMQCLYPEAASGHRPLASGTDRNEHSLVFRLDYGEFHMLLTGDMSAEGEKNLLALESVTYDETYFGARQEAQGKDGMNGKRKTRKAADGTWILKVAHHGSGYSSSEGFLAWLNPDYAVISCGKKNRYGHPHPDTVERLSGCGSQILQTKESGAIIWKTDGHRITWKGWKTVREE